ncbi:uncharacterized protein LOC135375136 [Ornithodoros turicata]|uniref:uncharacterized protein LOC135368180 n=1 Tax=Ornithodoros turicata TaxID=34597 RepID=UPI00313922AA
MEATDEQVIRRREIRKKKILENSDARWRKIIGYGSTDESATRDKPSGEPLPAAATAPPFVSPAADSRRAYSLDEVTSNSTLSSSSVTHRPSAKVDVIPSVRLSALDTRTRSLDESTSANGIPKRSAIYAFPKKVSDTESRSYARCPGDGGGFRVWLVEALADRGLDFFRACLVALIGVCARIWLALGVPHFLSETVLLPFCLLEAAICSYPKFLTKVSWCQRPQMSLGSSGSASCMSTSILAAVLVLCGVSPRASAAATSGLRLMADLTSDLMLYIFCFVVFHVFWIDWVG